MRTDNLTALPQIGDGGAYDKATTTDGPGDSLRQQRVGFPGASPDAGKERRTVSIVPPPEYVPARNYDARLRTLPISSDLAALLGPRVKRTTWQNSRGCWIRKRSYVHGNGYSYITRMVRGKTTYYLAHRVMFVWKCGPIPEGYTIDHTCDDPRCCRPEHLRAVTHRQNVLRSTTNPYAINARMRREREGGAA